VTLSWLPSLGGMPKQDSRCAGNVRNRRIIAIPALFAQLSREPRERSANKKVKRVLYEIFFTFLWNLSNRKGREEIRQSGVPTGSRNSPDVRVH